MFFTQKILCGAGEKEPFPQECHHPSQALWLTQCTLQLNVSLGVPQLGLSRDSFWEQAAGG